MNHQRYRPTFMLNCVTFIFVIACSCGAFALANAVGNGTLGLVALICGVVLLFFADLIGDVIVVLMTRHAQQGTEIGSSCWFIDIEQSKRREIEKFHEATKDNPTIR